MTSEHQQPANAGTQGGAVHEHPEHPQTGPIVTVTVDNTPKEIHRGSYVVSELKERVGVDASRALDQVVNGEFVPLDDSARVTIKGGEVFVSHVRDGGSS